MPLLLCTPVLSPLPVERGYTSSFWLLNRPDDLVFFKSWDDFSTEQFNRAHHVFVTHVAFIPVDQDIAGLEILFHIPEFFDDRLWAADHDVMRLLQLLIGHAPSHGAGANEGARHFDAHGFPGLIRGRVVEFDGTTIAVVFRPQKRATDLLSLFVGVRHQAPHKVAKVLRPWLEAHLVSRLVINTL